MRPNCTSNRRAAPPPEPPAEPPLSGASDSLREAIRDDPIDKMGRIELIQYGAQKYPGQRQWALLGTEKLRAALHELEAPAVKVARRDLEAGD